MTCADCGQVFASAVRYALHQPGSRHAHRCRMRVQASCRHTYERARGQDYMCLDCGKVTVKPKFLTRSLPMKKALLTSLVLCALVASFDAQATVCTVDTSPDLNLTWDVSQSGADAIMDVMVERQIDSGAWTVMAQLTPPTMYFEAETSPPHFKGHNTYWRVRFAYPDGSFGEYSDIACKSFHARPLNPKAQ